MKYEKSGPGFGANLQALRQHRGMSQEELAEVMGVSRQSVSKWETGTAYPEMQTILTLCDHFDVALDVLLRGDVSQTMAEDRADYNRFMDRFSKAVAGGVGLILFGVGLLALLEGLRALLDWPDYMQNVGTAVLLLFILCAVTLFVVFGIQEETFREKNPVIEPFYTQAELDQFSARQIWLIAAPVAVILGDVVLLVLLGDWMEQLGLDAFLMAGFLWILAGAVTTLVWTGMQEDKYDIPKYNLENTPEFKHKEAVIGVICAVIMLLATAAYIALSARDGSGGSSWWVFAVGGIGCGIAAIMVNAVYDRKIKARTQSDRED